MKWDSLSVKCHLIRKPLIKKDNIIPSVFWKAKTFFLILQPNFLLIFSCFDFLALYAHNSYKKLSDFLSFWEHTTIIPCSELFRKTHGIRSPNNKGKPSLSYQISNKINFKKNICKNFRFVIILLYSNILLVIAFIQYTKKFSLYTCVFSDTDNEELSVHLYLL